MKIIILAFLMISLSISSQTLPETDKLAEKFYKELPQMPLVEIPKADVSKIQTPITTFQSLPEYKILVHQPNKNVEYFMNVNKVKAAPFKSLMRNTIKTEALVPKKEK